MDITWRDFSGEGEGRNGGEGTGKKKQNWQIQNRQGKVKNSIGNGEAKELTCTTHGHELIGGNAGGLGSAGQRKDKGVEIGKIVVA